MEKILIENISARLANIEKILTNSTDQDWELTIKKADNGFILIFPEEFSNSTDAIKTYEVIECNGNSTETIEYLLQWISNFFGLNSKFTIVWDEITNEK